MGILAHVDSGKTTLAESMLYTCGSIRKLGRVDHKDAFLDTYDLEKNRGITIFSKQAQLQLDEKQITLLDTPGHVDFSAEMERTLQVLDYAILVISGADGVQGHVLTLWRLLHRYRIPTFLFINKMDQQGCEKARLLEELRRQLSEACIDFTVLAQTDVENTKDFSANSGKTGGVLALDEEIAESLAMCDEVLLEKYLETGSIEEEDIRSLIAERKIFPCYFGSALKIQGITEFLRGLGKYMKCPEYPDTFGARVYKIARDAKGERLTYLKVTGGNLTVKSVLSGTGAREQKDHVWEEKVNQIRIYSGSGYQMVNEAEAGMICAVTGLNYTRCGEGLGYEKGSMEAVLEPVLTYQIILPEGCDVHKTWLKLQQLEEEEPQLHIVWKEQVNEIHAQVMGAVQIEILKSLIKERFDLDVDFGAGSIVYKETIQNTVEGVGHFEPLRHYAEVHLLLEPLERGSGLVFDVDCSEDMLDRNWQRLIYTHLLEKKHRGVLTGSEITDMKITLKAGRAHQKHTEGGDFRQATYRAVRQGLRQAESVILEPYYEFKLEVPSDMVGRAMSDIQRMCGEFAPPEPDGDLSVIRGKAPVSTMQDYQMEVISYTRGQGRLFCTLQGYDICHNMEEVIAEMAYEPEQDLENPTGSVFCAHGAGFVVAWDRVSEYMHLESVLAPKRAAAEITAPKRTTSMAGSLGSSWQMEKELQEIFDRTYARNSSGEKRNTFARTVSTYSGPSGSSIKRKAKDEKEYLLVDGYNIIFAWDDLKELAKVNIEAARNKLMDIMCNYQGYKDVTLILVYDAYKVKGNPGEIFKYHNIHVVYTKEAETADQYIEKTVHEIGRKYQVTVATSDGMEQVIIMGQGAQRMSARGLLDEVEAMNQEIRKQHLSKSAKNGQYLFENLSDELAEDMEDIRLGKKEFEDLE